MTASRRAFVVVAALCIPTGPRPRETQEPTTTAYETSGVPVIHRVTPVSDLVAVRLYLLGGSRQLTASTAGVEALLLRAGEIEHQRAMSATGGYAVLDVGADWSVVGFVGLKSEFDAMWSVLARRLTAPPRDAEAIRQARSELRAAARRRNSHPDLRIDAIAQRNLFRDHPYGIPAEGTDQSLAALTATDLAQYAEGQMITSRMLLVVVGDVPRSTLDSLIDSTLGRLSRGNYEWTLPPPISPRPNTWLIDHRPMPTNYVLGYFAGPDPSNIDDYFAFRVATRVLSSQLQWIVREQRSLSYATYAPFLDRAIPIGGVYASSADPGTVFRLMIDQLEWLQTLEGQSTSWSRFTDQFTLDQLAWHMTTEGQAQALGRAQLLFGDHTVADSYVDRLRQVTLRQVALVARDYMRHAQYAYLGDTTLMRGRW